MVRVDRLFDATWGRPLAAHDARYWSIVTEREPNLFVVNVGYTVHGVHKQQCEHTVNTIVNMCSDYLVSNYR
jgi:hypothetical protein